MLRSAVLALALAAAASAAAKPPAAPAADPDRAMYRLQGFGACVADNHPGAKYDLRTDDISADCNCAIDRYMAGRDTDRMQRILPHQGSRPLDPLYRQCRTERIAGVAAPESSTALPTAATPDERGEAAPPPLREDAEEAESFDPLGWVRHLSLPRWSWALLLVVPLLAFGLFRRRGGRGDLVAPPSSMRPGSQAPKPPQWPSQP